MPTPASQQDLARRENVKLAYTSSHRIRTVRGLIRRMDECPPLTREQRQQVIEAAIALPVLEDQR